MITMVNDIVEDMARTLYDRKPIRCQVQSSAGPIGPAYVLGWYEMVDLHPKHHAMLLDQAKAVLKV